MLSNEEIKDSNPNPLSENDMKLLRRVFFSALDDAHKKSDDLTTGEQNEEDDEFDDLSDVDDQDLVNRYKELKRVKGTFNSDEQEKQRLIISEFSADKMDRFEAYRRMRVNKPGIRKVCSGELGHTLPQNLAVVLAGLSKLLLGEIITRAYEVQESQNKAKLKDDVEIKKEASKHEIKSDEDERILRTDLSYNGDFKSPLQPSHIREAWRLYRLESSSSLSNQWKTQGGADGKLFR